MLTLLKISWNFKKYYMKYSTKYFRSQKHSYILQHYLYIWSQVRTTTRGAGTNLKVGHLPAWAKRRRKKNFRRAPSIFGSTITISRFGERFRDGQYSLVRLLFAVLLLTVPPCHPFVKVGGTFPPLPIYQVCATDNTPGLKHKRNC